MRALGRQTFGADNKMVPSELGKNLLAVQSVAIQ